MKTFTTLWRFSKNKLEGFSHEQGPFSHDLGIFSQELLSQVNLEKFAPLNWSQMLCTADDGTLM